MTFSNHNIKELLFDRDSIQKELKFKTSRSSGSGGQHANKVSTKVELLFDLKGSLVLTPEQKLRFTMMYGNRLTKHGVLSLTCDETRSQLRNKEIVQNRFFSLLDVGLVLPKKRKTTQIPRAVKKKRFNDKKRRSATKQNRQRPDID